MKRLLMSEYKKLWKKKLNCILMILLIGFMAYQAYDNYHRESPFLPQDMVYMTEDQEPITDGIAYYRYADSYLHQYAGDFNEDLINRMNKDYEQLMKKYQRKTIDRDKMRSVYGSDWEEFLKNAATGKYSYTYVQERIDSMNIKGYGMYEENQFAFDVYYKEDPTYMLYQMIYTGYSSYATSFDLYTEMQAESSLTLRGNNYLSRFKTGAEATQDRYDIITMYRGMDNKQEMLVADHYMDQLMKNALRYDSTIGNELFLKGLKDINFLTLLVIAVLLTSIFAQEANDKTDQIITPTKEGASRLFMAKLLCGISVAVGILLLEVLLLVIASILFVPMRSLDLPSLSQADSGGYYMMSYLFTYKEIIIGSLLLLLTSVFVIALLTMTISYFTKNRFVTIIVMMLFIFGSIMLAALSGDALPYLRSFLPTSMLECEHYFAWKTYGTIPLVSIGGNLIPLRYIAIAAWIPVSIVLYLAMKQKERKHIVLNR